MKKPRVLYTCRNRNKFEEAFTSGLPVAGLVVKTLNNEPEFRCAFREKGGTFGWVGIVFNDSE